MNKHKEIDLHKIPAISGRLSSFADHFSVVNEATASLPSDKMSINSSLVLPETGEVLRKSSQAGSVNPLLVSSIIMGLLAALFAGAFFWAYGNYSDQKNNTDAKISVAVTDAKKQQMAADEKDYLEKEKQPYKQLIGPDDLGRVSISYPKNWSVYVAQSNSDAYEAYLNQDSVQQVTNTQSFAARVVMTNQLYEKVIATYDALVKKGDLKSSPITVNNFQGVRLDGKFSATRSGSAVIFKVRDKTLTIATDIDSFKSDFDNIIIKSLDFNP